MTIQFDFGLFFGCRCTRVADANFDTGGRQYIGSHTEATDDTRYQSMAPMTTDFTDDYRFHQWLPIIPRNRVIPRQIQCCQPIFFAFFWFLINFCNFLRVGNTGFHRVNIGHHRVNIGNIGNIGFIRVKSANLFPSDTDFVAADDLTTRC